MAPCNTNQGTIFRKRMSFHKFVYKSHHSGLFLTPILGRSIVGRIHIGRIFFFFSRPDTCTVKQQIASVVHRGAQSFLGVRCLDNGEDANRVEQYNIFGKAEVLAIRKFDNTHALTMVDTSDNLPRAEEKLPKKSSRTRRGERRGEEMRCRCLAGQDRALKNDRTLKMYVPFRETEQSALRIDILVQGKCRAEGFQSKHPWTEISRMGTLMTKKNTHTVQEQVQPCTVTHHISP